MSLLDQARLDNQSITSNSNDFAVTADFTSNQNGATATVNVLNTKHHLKVDYDGDATNTKISSVAVNETLLNNASYPTRINQEVRMEGDTVVVADSTGVDKNYTVIETFSDESLGMIILILGDIDN